MVERELRGIEEFVRRLERSEATMIEIEWGRDRGEALNGSGEAGRRKSE